VSAGKDRPVYHGGDLAAASVRFGVPADGWVDLSTGINPWPYPASIDPAHLARLPDGAQLAALADAAAGAYGMASADGIAAAPGTQALIQMLPRLRPPGRVAVVSPTYGEHAPAWRQAGHDVGEIASLDEAGDADVVVVTRPNNPDGAVAAAEELRALAARLASRGGELILDEAFADTWDAPSLAAGSPGIVALRSFGKFYGLPGLRLGFALCSPAQAGEIRTALGPWAVSTTAAEIGRAALADRAWQATTRARLDAAAARLDAALGDAGLAVAGGTSLFRLALCDDAQALFEALGRAGIFVRHFPGRTGRLRVGLPPDDAAFARLDAALRQARGG
jgi:cobalamin biosynthetic protein CobC